MLLVMLDVKVVDEILSSIHGFDPRKVGFLHLDAGVEALVVLDQSVAEVQISSQPAGNRELLLG
jgi:hypothetical protein